MIRDFLGARLRFEGERSLLETLARYYPSTPSLAAADKAPDIVLCWRGCLCELSLVTGDIAVFRAPTEELRPAMTPFIVGAALEAWRPALTFFHGNLLKSEQSDAPLLLFGDSGAGKSTLTQLLTEQHGYALLAEDLLVLDLEAGAALPFPRAAALRDAPKTEASPNWQEYSADSPSRWLFQTAAPTALHPISLSGARLVFLKRDSEKAPTPREVSRPIVFWFSAFTDSGRDRLLALIPELTFDDRAHCVGVRIPVHRWSEALQESLIAEARADAALLLRVDRGGSTPCSTVPYSQPSLATLPLVELPVLLRRHQRRFSSEPVARPGRQLFETLRLFSKARFFCLCVGGTAEETAALLAEIP